MFTTAHESMFKTNIGNKVTYNFMNKSFFFLKNKEKEQRTEEIGFTTSCKS